MKSNMLVLNFFFQFLNKLKFKCYMLMWAYNLNKNHEKFHAELKTKKYRQYFAINPSSIIR